MGEHRARPVGLCSLGLLLACRLCNNPVSSLSEEDLHVKAHVKAHHFVVVSKQHVLDVQWYQIAQRHPTEEVCATSRAHG